MLASLAQLLPHVAPSPVSSIVLPLLIVLVGGLILHTAMRLKK